MPCIFILLGPKFNNPKPPSQPPQTCLLGERFPIPTLQRSETNGANHLFNCTFTRLAAKKTTDRCGDGCHAAGREGLALKRRVKPTTTKKTHTFHTWLVVPPQKKNLQQRVEELTIPDPPPKKKSFLFQF